MAKSITREITVTVYKFAHVDAATLAITDVVDYESTETLGPRSLGAIGKDLDNRICIGSSNKTKKYELPLDRFIAACEQYAKDVENAVTAEADNQ